MAEIVEESGVGLEDIAFIGDDTPDIQVFERVGMSFAVGDAHELVKAAADTTTTANGGLGAVREIIDLLISTRSS